MNKILSAFPVPDGPNSVLWHIYDKLEQQWRLKVSFCSEGKYLKPWLKGELMSWLCSSEGAGERS
jgi:hypothetical protein